MNAPTERLKEIIEVLPGMKSPTVMPLAQEGWSSVHTVLDEKRFWEIIGKLKALGAEGILVLPMKLDSLGVTETEIAEAEKEVPIELKAAIMLAQKNIHTFHSSQRFEGKKVQTVPGVTC